MNSVFCTSTRTPMDGSTSESASTASSDVKEARAAAAEPLRNLDAHDAEFEELRDKPGRDGGVLIHLAHDRPHLTGRELADALEEQGSRRRCGT